MPEPSAARVLPHTAAGALLLMLGLLARCQSREVVCLKKKKNWNPGSAEKGKPTDAFSAWAVLFADVWQIQCQLIVNRRGVEG